MMNLVKEPQLSRFAIYPARIFRARQFPPRPRAFPGSRLAQPLSCPCDVAERSISIVAVKEICVHADTESSYDASNHSTQQQRAWFSWSDTSNAD
ncbi:MAG: hypothetical protein WA192_00930 [Candidatus Acidiferrales bacterium]